MAAPSEHNNSGQNIELTPELLEKILHRGDLREEDEFDLADLWKGLARRKWLILFFTALFTLLMYLFSTTMEPKYESSVKLMPVAGGDPSSGLMAKYGGLASLAGISLPAGGDISPATEAIEVLNSKRFIAEFIEENDLKKVLFAARWDAEKQTWIKKESYLVSIQKLLGVDGMENQAGSEPSIYEAVEYFNKNILSAGADGKSGLYKLTVKWYDPVLARDWANQLVKRVDDELRHNALKEAQATIDYMNEKLETIQLQDIRSIALKTIEENMKKITFAQVQNEYVFKVIDPAVLSEKPVGPKKALMIIAGFVLGLMLGVFLALVLNWREKLSSVNES